MNIVLDVSAIPAQRGGAGTYVRELLTHLPGAGVRAIAVAPERDSRSWVGADRVLRVAPGSRAQRLAWEQTGLCRAVERGLFPETPPHVLHSPHYTMPTFSPSVRGRASAWRPARVVTIHDLTFFSRPKDHEIAKRHFFQAAIKRAAAHADGLIAVSEATADALVDIVKPRAPITVIPHGVDVRKFSPGPQPNDVELRSHAGVRSDRPYVMHLGTIEPRKNVSTLIKGYGQYLAQHPSGESPALVLVGTAWSGMEEQIQPYISAALRGAPNASIVRCIHVDDESVAALLRGASAVIYPSFEEGFGLPILEAMACGVPVVTSKNSVMASIAQDGVWTIDPHDSGTICNTLEVLLGSPLEAAEKVSQGFVVSSRYRWDRSAAAHAELYQSLL